MTNSYIRSHARHFNFNQFIKDAFNEDVGDGDHTSLSTIPASHKGKMRLFVKEDGILAGMEAAKEIFRITDPSFRFKQLIKDGTQVKKGDVAFEVTGNSQKLLTTERLVLNIMQRMSGIATHTYELMQLCKGTKAKVIDTRKTTPGFRFFEKWAVVIGGGANHRYGLFDMILIKDNHIDFAGGISKAIDAVHAYQKKNKKKLKVEIEVRSLNDIKEILKKGGVDRILIDNFTPAETKKAIALIDGKFQTESSGGINKKTIRAYAQTGVDFISVGALTHHVSSLDLSLKAVK
ncbi:MAG: nadC [Bacteroidetes bacterium]|jgi:nicotinate-nucleotide pyrophosphorylase (carboxylating)|nr:nadC [Bacteroidota bacterium]